MLTTTSPRSRTLVALVAATTLVAAAVVATTAGHARAGAAASHTRTLSLYSVPKLQGFVNNADDRERGKGNNPFGNYHVGVATPPTKELLNGPFPGDEGLFTSNVYAGSTTTKPVGAAVYICQYTFAKNAFCDASYQLDGGTVVAVGALNAYAKTFTLTITGGTGSYRGATGTVAASPSGSPSQTTVLMLATEHLVFTLDSPNSSTTGTTLYSVAVDEQFVDNGDDEVRGYVNNPFRIKNKALQAAEDEDKSGPFPGDETYFKFKVYDAASLAKTTGTGIFTCNYYFNRFGYCDASYTLPGGTLIGAGAFSFNATTFTLAITGGTGKYRGASGDLVASPSSGHAQRLALTLLKVPTP